MTADERRRSVLSAATAEFARGGFAGTSTEDIARRAGISQPYLFRLYRTKRDLFLAVVADGFERVRTTFERASEGFEGDEALLQMGLVYSALLSDADLLRLQLHAYAASGDETIRAAVAGRFTDLANYVAERTGVSAEALREFFATGMLLNVVAALDLSAVEGMFEGVVCTPASIDVRGASPTR
jgi:AcrR family transcriptional regulator